MPLPLASCLVPALAVVLLSASPLCGQISPAPLPAPAPVESAPAPVIGPAVDLTSYRAALTPSAQVAVDGQASSVPLSNRGGVFDPVGVIAPASGGRPPAVNVRLQFNPTQAGALASVQLLDGGDLFSADGKTIASGGAFFEIDGGGGLAFVFRPPSRSDHYQVAVRLGNVETIVPVDVLAASTSPSAEPNPTPPVLPGFPPAPLPVINPALAPASAADR